MQNIMFNLTLQHTINSSHHHILPPWRMLNIMFNLTLQHTINSSHHDILPPWRMQNIMFNETLQNSHGVVDPESGFSSRPPFSPSSIHCLATPNERESERKSIVVLLGSYNFQFTCRTKRK